MTLELPLTSETDARIRARAAAAGQDIATFVLQALLDKLADEAHSDADSQPNAAVASAADWHDKLRAAIRLHPIVPQFVDDSRETIYAGRGQ